MVKRLRHRPFTAATGVQIPLESPAFEKIPLRCLFFLPFVASAPLLPCSCHRADARLPRLLRFALYSVLSRPLHSLQIPLESPAFEKIPLRCLFFLPFVASAPLLPCSCHRADARLPRLLRFALYSVLSLPLHSLQIPLVSPAFEKIPSWVSFFLALRRFRSSSPPCSYMIVFLFRFCWRGRAGRNPIGHISLFL